MTVRQLIKKLQNLNHPNYEVYFPEDHQDSPTPVENIEIEIMQHRRNDYTIIDKKIVVLNS